MADLFVVCLFCLFRSTAYTRVDDETLQSIFSEAAVMKKFKHEMFGSVTCSINIIVYVSNTTNLDRYPDVLYVRHVSC